MKDIVDFYFYFCLHSKQLRGGYQRIAAIFRRSEDERNDCENKSDVSVDDEGEEEMNNQALNDDDSDSNDDEISMMNEFDGNEDDLED